MRRKAKLIIQDVKKEIEKHNVCLIIRKNHKLHFQSERCFGYFDPPLNRKSGVLGLAIGEKRHVDYLWDLAHELAHFRQWKREDPVYLKYLDDDSFYNMLEQRTEKEAKRIFLQWGLHPSQRLIKRSQKYLLEIS
jgi:hypothetical protein